MPLPQATLRRSRLLTQLPAFQAAARTSPSPLAITGLKAYPLQEPVSKRKYTVVAIEAANGAKGYGECAGSTAQDVAAALNAISGLPATAYEVARVRLAAVPSLRGAIDMAMLDIAAKHSKSPVYRLLGGPTRNKARILCRISGESDEALIAAMKKARSEGHVAFMVPVPPVLFPNQGQAFVHKVRKRMEALRQAGGEDVDFALDGAGTLTPGDAASLSTALESLHLLWIDEPSSVRTAGVTRKLGAERVTPIGLGAHVELSGGFQDLLREEVADVLRPDLGRFGITGIRRIAALAETYYTAVAPAHEGGPVGTAAALQLAASLPNFFIQQIPVPSAPEDRKMRAEICSGSLETVKEGYAALPTTPGLGFEINEKALASYAERAI